MQLNRYGSQLRSATSEDGIDTAVLVPVFAEQPDRVLRQLRSIEQQTSFDLSRLELLYVVNAKPTAKPADAVLNEAVLAMLRSYQPTSFQLSVVDATSEGLAIPESNVGCVRQLGLKLLEQRFAHRHRRGVVLSTDADAYLDDPSFLHRLDTIMAADHELIAIAAGRRNVVDLDSDTAEAQVVLRLLPKVALYQQWTNLHRVLTAGEVSGHLKFHGQATVVRSDVVGLVGGVPPIALGEDVLFGERIRDYARANGLRTVTLKSELRVRTALRVSSRTENQNFARILQLVSADRVLVDDPLAAGQQVELTAAACERWARAVRDLPDGQAFLEFITPGTGSSVAAAVLPDGRWIGDATSEAPV